MASTSDPASSGTRVVRNAKRPGKRPARTNTASRRSRAAAASTAPPVTMGYLAKGALTSTEKWASG